MGKVDKPVASAFMTGPQVNEQSQQSITNGKTTLVESKNTQQISSQQTSSQDVPLAAKLNDPSVQNDVEKATITTSSGKKEDTEVDFIDLEGGTGPTAAPSSTGINVKSISP